MNRSILLIENDALTRQDLAEILSDAGYAVEQAADDAEALAKMRRSGQVPCVILLDLRIPGANLAEFRTRLRSDPLREHVPIVLISGDAELARHARDLGAVGYLRKPFGLDELSSLLDTVIEG